MPKTQTVLLITRDLLVRADFRLRARQPRMTGFWQQRRPAVEDFPALVEAALRLGPKRVARVWVLSSEIWTQILELPSETVSGMASEEMDRALAFEAEPLSGIGAFDSRVSHVELSAAGGGRRFWLCQVLNGHLEQVQYLIEQSGGRLAGMGHPGGLPRPIDGPAAAENWRRIEFWPDAVLWLQAESSRPLDVQVLNADPRSDRWRTEWNSRLDARAERAHAETLRGTAWAPGAAADGDRIVDLHDALQLEAWLAAWAAHLSQERVEIPLVVPRRRPLGAGKLRAAAAVVTLLAAAICVGHYAYMQHRLNRLEEETTALEEPAQQLATAKKEADALQQQVSELEGEIARRRENLDYFQHVMGSQRQRFSRLLSVLAGHGEDGVLIQGVEGDGQEVIVRGICLRPELADRLAMAVDQGVASLGWQVDPPEKEAQTLRSDGGPWKFHLRLTEIPDWEPEATPAGEDLNLVKTAERKALAGPSP
jgi:hypothetical protein